MLGRIGFPDGKAGKGLNKFPLTALNKANTTEGLPISILPPTRWILDKQKAGSFVANFDQELLGVFTRFADFLRSPVRPKFVRRAS